MIQTSKTQESPLLYLAIALSGVVVFAADVYTRLGIAVWVFYLVPLALTLASWRPSLPIIVAIAETVLSAIGFLLSRPGVQPTVSITNRAFGVATITVMAGMSWAFVRGKISLYRQEWLQTGQTMLNDRMAGEQSLQQLAENVLSSLAEYLDAQAAVMFVQEDGSFRRLATWAVPDQTRIPEQVIPGQTLLGQAAKDCRVLVVRDFPEGHVEVGSGLGHTRPRHLVIAPAVADGSAIAVLEFGFLNSESEDRAELMKLVSNAVALRIRSVKYRVRLEDLLEETQRQAEEIQAQSEELRVSNDQLEKQNEHLHQSQIQLEGQQAALEETNAQLEEQSSILESQRDDLVRAKSELETRAHELEQASRYKTDFLASMSHELRTPLNSALILARLLFENRSGNLTPEQVEYARSIEASGNALLQLINDVLDLAKIEAGRMEVRAQNVELSKIASSLRSTFEPMAKAKNLRFEIAIASDVAGPMVTDPQRMEQILTNLLSNATKFTAQGEVTLRISRAPDTRLCFAVSDTGIGIPEDQQRLIFERFRQVDSTLGRNYGGTGLGLSISKELAGLLGGELSVTSEPGRGSTFTLLLPQIYRQERVESIPQEQARPMTAIQRRPDAVRKFTAEPQTAPSVADDRDKLSGSGRLVLVVEDDELFAQILRDLARELNFKCLVASTASEALDLALRYLPKAILLDVVLPDNSGLYLLDRLKLEPRTRHIPVHMLSVDDYTQTALALGAVGYALKPVKRDELVSAFQLLESRLSQKVRRVLIVEDDELQQESLKHLLSSREVEAVGARTAIESLEQLRTATFDCMVLDLNLPDGSGLSILESISREDRYSFPPVIVYTGRDLTLDEEQALRRYSDSIIIKGARSPERLLDEVTLFLHQVIAELPPEQQRMLEKARNRDARLEGRVILVVEDDIRNVFALTSILEVRGAIVQVARNGIEALDALERSHQPGARQIDLVLMDIMMPEMDGLTATREIRRRSEWGRVPVIALTAKALKGDQQEVLAAGANDYMSKPLDVEQLLSLMRVWMPR